MGQKVNPHGLRVGVIKDWDSRWYAEDKFADYLVEDYNIRTFLKKKLYSAGVSKIEIERASDRVKIIIYTAKPGIVIGKGGAEIEKVKAELKKFTDKKLIVDIKEVKRILTDIAKNEKRILDQDGVKIFVSSLADSSVMMGIRCWVSTSDYVATKWALNEEIKIRFDEEGIEIPYQKLDVCIKNEVNN